MSRIELVDRETWLSARKDLLVAEKELSRCRHALSAERRKMPGVVVTKPYAFQTEDGTKSLPELFGPHRQLVIYHFMLGKNWAAGCPSCSFWADSFNGTSSHLAAVNTKFLCVSTASLDRIRTYKKRMGWLFEWVSAGESDFNVDFGVTFPDRQPGPTGGYNYTENVFGEEMPGISTFTKLDDGRVAHTYSTYGPGLDMVNAAFSLLDLTPLGRQEEEGIMNWVRRHDEYVK